MTGTLARPPDFDYDTAFSRNIGWVTSPEQAKLRGSRIAIAGLGGVGGAHLFTLARLGIANFNIADFDEFDVHNLNRQTGVIRAPPASAARGFVLGPEVTQ